MTILAIDPGKSGGIAVLDDGPARAVPMPDTEGDVAQLLKEIASPGAVAFIEEVGGYTKSGSGQPGSAMFKFGRGFGFILGVLAARGVRVELVKPQKWQKALSLGTRGELTKTAWKNKLKARAQQLFPHLKVTLGTADALLLLEYATQSRVDVAKSTCHVTPGLPL